MKLKMADKTTEIEKPEKKMRPIRIAVIGLGSMGKNHVRVLNELEEADLVAVSDVNKEQLNKICAMYKVKGYGDYNQMLSREKLDAVVVAVPTSYHKKVAVDVLNKGVNAFVEKPIASTIKEATEIINASKKNKKMLMVGHIERFNPAVQELKKRIKNGELGNIYKFEVARLSPFPTRMSDVGVVVDLAVHDLDILSYINESDIATVYAETEKRIHSTHEDMLCAVLRYKNGVIGMLTVDWLSPLFKRKLSITGEKGMFVVNYRMQSIYFYTNQASHNIEYPSIVHSVAVGDVIKINVEKQEPLKLELKSFIESVQKGERPLVSGEDGLLALRMAMKLIESAKKRKALSMK